MRAEFPLAILTSFAYGCAGAGSKGAQPDALPMTQVYDVGTVSDVYALAEALPDVGDLTAWPDVGGNHDVWIAAPDVSPQTVTDSGQVDTYQAQAVLASGSEVGLDGPPPLPDTCTASMVSCSTAISESETPAGRERKFHVGYAK